MPCDSPLHSSQCVSVIHSQAAHNYILQWPWSVRSCIVPSDSEQPEILRDSSAQVHVEYKCDLGKKRQNSSGEAKLRRFASLAWVLLPGAWSGAGEAGGGGGDDGGGWLFPSKSSPTGCHLLSITTLPASVAALQPTHVLRLLAKELNLFASPEFKQVHKLLVHSLIPQCGLTQLSTLHGFTGCALGDS